MKMVFEMKIDKWLERMKEDKEKEDKKSTSKLKSVLKKMGFE